jgi:hypothetical protein
MLSFQSPGSSRHVWSYSTLVVDGLRWNILNFDQVFCHVIFPKEKGDRVGLISERASLGRLLLFRHASTTIEPGS